MFRGPLATEDASRVNADLCRGAIATAMPTTPGKVRHDEERSAAKDGRPITAPSATELNDAAAACEFPLWIWTPPDGIISILNPAAETLVGLPRDQVVGHHVTEFLSPTQFVEVAMSALASGALKATLTKREVRTRDATGRPGSGVPVWIWTRGIEVTDGPRSAVSLVMPAADVGRLGTDPGRPWRHLADVVVGQTDESWRIVRISSEVTGVLGARPRDLIGTPLRDLLHPDDVDGIGVLEGNDPRLPMRGRLRRPDGDWTEVGLMFAEVDRSERICFALITHPGGDEQPNRIAELEGRLRRIADEVRAARVLDTVNVLPASSDLPLGELSSRQWEILSRLLRGQRVNTIARELYVSPSTVRNHLSSIFRQFGVHSQGELLELLRNS